MSYACVCSTMNCVYAHETWLYMHKIKQMWCKCKMDQNGLHNQLCPIPRPPAIRLEFIISFFGGSFLELFCEAVLLLMCGGTPIVLQLVLHFFWHIPNWIHLRLLLHASHSQMQLQTYKCVYVFEFGYKCRKKINIHHVNLDAIFIQDRHAYILSVWPKCVACNCGLCENMKKMLVQLLRPHHGHSSVHAKNWWLEVPIPNHQSFIIVHAFVSN